MEEFNTNRDGVGHTCVKPGEHNKLDEVVERIQKKTGLKASSEGEYLQVLSRNQEVSTREVSPVNRPMVQLNLNKFS